MGLDNSINFRFRKKGEKNSHIVEICYWRKYWNFRNDIIKYMDEKFERPDEYTYIIPSQNSFRLKCMANILKEYCNISHCKNCDTCPWDPAEQAYHNRNELSKLQFLIDFIDRKISLYEFFCAIQCWDKYHFKEEFFELIEAGEIEYEIEFIDSY